jgi:hypothetical protein
MTRFQWTAVCIGTALLLSACGGGSDDAATVTTPTAPTSPTSPTTPGTAVANPITNASTAGIRCAESASVFNSSASVNATSTAAWSCNSTERLLTANGMPDHAVGTFPNADNPNAITAQSVSVSATLSPAVVSTHGHGHAGGGLRDERREAGPQHRRHLRQHRHQLQPGGRLGRVAHGGAGADLVQNSAQTATTPMCNRAGPTTTTACPRATSPG